MNALFGWAPLFKTENLMSAPLKPGKGRSSGNLQCLQGRYSVRYSLFFTRKFTNTFCNEIVFSFFVIDIVIDDDIDIEL